MAISACSEPAGKFLPETTDAFEASRAKFEAVVAQLEAPALLSATHGDVEKVLSVEGREVLRLLFQDHLALRKTKEPRRPVVVGKEGTARREVVEDTGRPLTSVFGEVSVERLAYRAPRKNVGNLMPLDLELNLPPNKYSFGLQRIAASEIARSSFESTQETIKDRTGVEIGKRQLEDLASEMAADFEPFYGIRSTQAQAGWKAILGSPNGICSPEGLDPSKLMVITTDGKGVAVVEEDLREETRKAAQKRKEKREKGDPTPKFKVPKLYRRRTAQVCAVYTVAPFNRTPEDILREMRHLQPVAPLPKRPRPENKRVCA